MIQSGMIAELTQTPTPRFSLTLCVDLELKLELATPSPLSSGNRNNSRTSNPNLPNSFFFKRKMIKNTPSIAPLVL